MGTNFIEANLIQQLMDMRKDVLHDIFLELPKEFDALDIDNCLEII